MHNPIPSLRQKFLEEFVITGNSKATAYSKSVLLNQILNIEKLKALGVQTVAEALKYQTNIRISEDNVLGSSMSMQGISGENVKILIDGVAQTGRQNGNFDLSQINLANVERIEIVEGPLSVQYGTNALAGTINIITTKKSSQPLDFQLNTYLESVGHINMSGNIGWLKEGHSILLSGGRNFFSGWSPVDTSRFKQWKPKIQYFGDVRYSYTDGSTQLTLSTNVFDEYILNRGMPLKPKNEFAFDDTYKTFRQNNALNWTQKYKNSWQTNIIVAYNKYKRVKNTFYRDLVNLTQSMTENEGDQDTTQFELYASRGVLSKTGHKNIDFEVGYDVNYEIGKGLRLKNGQQNIGDYALFTSVEWFITEGVTLRPGVRMAHNTSYKAPLIPSLQACWQLNDYWTLRASYGNGFRAPSLKELYFYFVDINHNIIGNENLIAEKSHNFNASSVFKKSYKNDDIVKFNVSTFYNDIENQISLAILRGKDNAFGYINTGKLRTLGGQIYSEYVHKGLTVGLGGSLNNSIYSFNVKDFQATTYELRANINYHIKPLGIDFSAFYKYNGRQNAFVLDDVGTITPTFLGAFNMADVSFGKKMFKNKLNIFIGIKNLFDIKNIESQLVNGTHGSGNGLSPVGTGKNFFIKCSYNL